MVSRAKKVVFVTGTFALVILYFFGTVADTPSWIGVAAVFPVGIVLSRLVNNYLDNRAKEPD